MNVSTPPKEDKLWSNDNSSLIRSSEPIAYPIIRWNGGFHLVHNFDEVIVDLREETTRKKSNRSQQGIETSNIDGNNASHLSSNRKRLVSRKGKQNGSKKEDATTSTPVASRHKPLRVWNLSQPGHVVKQKQPPVKVSSPDVPIRKKCNIGAGSKNKTTIRRITLFENTDMGCSSARLPDRVFNDTIGAIEAEAEACIPTTSINESKSENSMIYNITRKESSGVSVVESKEDRNSPDNISGSTINVSSNIASAMNKPHLTFDKLDEGYSNNQSNNKRGEGIDSNRSVGDEHVQEESDVDSGIDMINTYSSSFSGSSFPYPPDAKKPSLTTSSKQVSDKVRMQDLADHLRNKSNVFKTSSNNAHGRGTSPVYRRSVVSSPMDSVQPRKSPPPLPHLRPTTPQLISINKQKQGSLPTPPTSSHHQQQQRSSHRPHSGQQANSSLRPTTPSPSSSNFRPI